MDLTGFVEFLLISVFYIISPIFATNSTVIFNNSSTNSVLANNSSTSSVLVNNNSTTIILPNTISVLPNNVSTTELPNLNNYFAYMDDAEWPTPTTNSSGPRKLSFDEIFSIKRKCCPLDKVFKGFDFSSTAVCDKMEIPQDVPGITSFERHIDEVHASGDALQSSEPFHCQGSILEPYENLSVWSDGSMDFYDEDQPIVISHKYLVYCIEFDEDSFMMYRCKLNDPPPTAYKIIKIISCVFLTGFIVIYMMKPQLHTLHNRCLMRLMICLLGKCLLSIIFHIQCGIWWIQYTSAAGTYFFYMGGFSWSTVICYDIWSGIRMKSTKNVQRLSVQKKIRNYSKYGWGIASAILFVALSVDFTIDILSSTWLGQILIAPDFSYLNKWMGSNKAMYVYFYGPLLTLNAINLLFFVLTIRTIIQVRNDNNNVFKKSECSRRHVQAEMKWFSVFAKLYIVMGISWILDIVAFELSDHSYDDLLSKNVVDIIVYSVDIFNICQGIMIFFITMFTKETARKLSKTFSSTIMKARGSLTNSRKAEDSSKERSECTSV